MAQTHFTEGSTMFSPILVLLSFLFLIFKHIKASNPPLPPGPYPWPVIGNLLQMGKKPHITLTNFSKQYGPLFSLRLGTQLLVVGSSKAAAMEILKTHDRILSGRYVPHMAPTKSSELNHLSLGWLVECNAKWKYLRTICKTELFSCRALESQTFIREEKVMQMVGFINTREGKVVKIREVATATVFNMLSNILVSRDLISLEHENEGGGVCTVLEDIAKLASTPNISDFYPILGRLDLQGLQKKTMELHRRSFSMCESIVKERRDGKIRGGDNSTRRDFLDSLINNGSSDDQINLLLMIHWFLFVPSVVVNENDYDI
ncbi:hypothetical protein Tsubulata_028832 [Turnera subulata]|uniref:Cytochrome P450 n=1 Tax=Turnera subulata TaxID=218843 RepID=A0A9Q0JB36_9ROSI|nr:hypothetical protein Tsubulata_028832 [Turnera subulata]